MPKIIQIVVKDERIIFLYSRILSFSKRKNMSVAAPGSTAANWHKPRLNYWQIWNMSFGFLGIQVGWGMQMGNMSAIYEYLGANPDQIPLLWLAAPMTVPNRCKSGGEKMENISTP